MTLVNNLVQEFSINAQCCDATSYLRGGELCATAGQCYDDVRPIGALYWFSIPYRLGAPPNLLIFLHAILLAFSIYLSYRVIKQSLEKTDSLSLVNKIILLTASATVHIIFAYPIFNYTQSDLPAALFLLSGIWIFTLSHSSKHKILLLCTTGFFWGAAYWIRAFYLYPILITLGCLLLLSFFQKKQLYLFTVIPIAFIPFLIQSSIIYQKTGVMFSYSNEKKTAYWRDLHLNSSAAGYDTILPGSGHYWNTPICDGDESVLSSLKAFDVSGLSCLFLNRLYFYMGSYLYTSYAEPSKGGKVYEIEIMNELTSKIYFGGAQKKEYLLSKDNIKNIPGNSTPLYLDSGWDYEVYLDTKANGRINAFTLSAEDQFGKTIGSTTAITDPQMDNTLLEAHLLAFPIQHRGYYTIKISFEQIVDGGALKAYQNKYHVHLSQTDLLVSNIVMKRYRTIPPPNRIWSKYLFVINLFALIIAVASVTVGFLQKNESSYIPSLLTSLCFCMSLLIIPEQRFFVAIAIFIWISFLNSLYTIALFYQQYRQSAYNASF